MTNGRGCCSFITVLLVIGSPGFAQDPTESDDIAAEFKGVKLLRLSPKNYADSFQCYLYTDAEHKQMRERHDQLKKPGSNLRGNSPLDGTYLILEVKKDRLILAPEIWSDHRRVRVIPLRYISDIYRAGMYAEAPK